MNAIFSKRTVAWSIISLLLLAAAVWFAWPQPIPVDIATVKAGPMSVFVEDEGMTKVRNVHTVSAPVDGKVTRTPLHVGDKVIGAETVVAVMQPASPGFLDDRSREELGADLAAAEAAVEFAMHEVKRNEAALELAQSEYHRSEALVEKNVAASEALDKATAAIEEHKHALAGAKSMLEVRQSEMAAIEARLQTPVADPASVSATAREARIHAPVTGRVLKIHQESETVVKAGTPLVDIGDPRDIEVVADLLSTDAVRIDVGAPVQIVDWGGSPINGRVERIDPAGLKKVSALGIEELRVRTIIGITDPEEEWSRLGHKFRVNVKIVLWNADNALKVPVAALFRSGDKWAVFAVKQGKAEVRTVEIGHRNNREAEVLSGLQDGDRVVLHPSDRISDGDAVTRREVH